MKKLPQTHCPKCRRKSISWQLRRCIVEDCGTRVFKNNESVSDTEPPGWFMWLPKGPYGAGWYRDGFIKRTRNWPGPDRGVIVASVRS